MYLDGVIVHEALVKLFVHEEETSHALASRNRICAQYMTTCPKRHRMHLQYYQSVIDWTAAIFVVETA